MEFGRRHNLEYFDGGSEKMLRHFSWRFSFTWALCVTDAMKRYPLYMTSVLFLPSLNTRMVSCIAAFFQDINIVRLGH
jgi:hypothetical protein